ncbi:cysteine--tRNA ligase [Azorhizobium doebereinerae]|uniref:cysteine--tRNA ligase n=1 Tax=Azorhizobium doebereinerae TaxID=281091 RepID=UPI0003F65970|nr:cysteine--tRNA ligase [Azorhizobium doebereinerae]
MELRLYNTLTRSKDPFRPLDPNHVRLYVCGPTVYDHAHIGNARPVIVFDVLYRLLRRLYGAAHVRYVRNITDVDDKINARAAERNISIRDLTEETYAWFRDDTAALGCLRPDVEPRATEHIFEMQALIERLVASGHAYVAEEHVLFSVPAMPEYGKLSRRPLDEMLNGARVDVAPFKRDPMDFVLWKPSAEGQPGWPSPCGIETPGRPGWHIECSAMSWRHLGETFDIHGGGIDLVFPHHENEIAQSRCAFGTGTMAQVWMHNGFLLLEGEKMSKSLGNFVTIRELLADWPGEVLRLAMLSTHYRQPINWTRQGIGFAAKTLDKWYRVIGDVEAETGEDNPFESEIADRLGDDINSPSAITHLHHLAEVAEHEDASSALKRRFKGAANLMGLLEETETQWRARQRAAVAVDPEAIAELIAQRNAARKARDFSAADHIREQLAAQGVVLMDNKDGTTSWELAR